MHALPISLIAGLVLMALASLMPNHYWPWSSFHADVVAGLAFAILIAGVLSKRRTSVQWPVSALVIGGVACIPLIQALLGLIFFWGDAGVVSIYLLGLALACVAGANLVRGSKASDVLRLFWLCLFASALISAGIALNQWLGIGGLGIYAAEMPPRGRPFANVAQPNQLATLLVLGVVAACALRHTRVLAGVSFALAVGFLCFATAMTLSRAAWLEVGFLVIWLIALRERASLQISRRAGVAIGAGFALLIVSWPAINNALLMSTSRTLQEQGEGGTRPIHWASMLDAIGRQPWFGYGWNQVSVAQSRVAADHPFTGEAIEHSHNLVLDLLVWNGVPLGVLIVVAFVWWAWRHIRACRSADVAFLLLGIGVVLVHAMLEFPLDYAYLLLPVGFMMGAVEALSPSGRFVAVPKFVTASLSAIVAALVVCIIIDYVGLEEDGRRLRFETANIGPIQEGSGDTHVILLTQLRDFYQFARAQPRAGMTPEQLDKMHKVVERYPYPAALFRYATAAGINGQPQAARDALAVLCKLHALLCVQGQDLWAEMANGAHPELKAIAWPPPPPRQMALQRDN